jgi:hypothetical protein
MPDFTVKYDGLDDIKDGMSTGSKDIDELFAEFAAAHLRSAGIAYEEGTSVFESLKGLVDEAVREAGEEAKALMTHSGKAATTNEEAQSREQKMVNRIDSHIDQFKA